MNREQRRAAEAEQRKANGHGDHQGFVPTFKRIEQEELTNIARKWPDEKGYGGALVRKLLDHIACIEQEQSNCVNLLVNISNAPATLPADATDDAKKFVMLLAQHSRMMLKELEDRGAIQLKQTQTEEAKPDANTKADQPPTETKEGDTNAKSAESDGGNA